MFKLRVLTYNLHKGFDTLGRKFALQSIRKVLHQTEADLVFLQEVVGEDHRKIFLKDNYPRQSQFEFLADTVWHHYSYGKNAVTEDGHHGNAILSLYPIKRWTNVNISTNRFEKRGLLHCVIPIPKTRISLHAICVHLNLLERGRKKQLKSLAERIREHVPANSPLIVAGDFNDWRDRASPFLAKECRLKEAYSSLHGDPAATFPSMSPVLKLDRIYVRGLEIVEASVLKKKPWRSLSDHCAFKTTAILDLNK